MISQRALRLLTRKIRKNSSHLQDDLKAAGRADTQEVLNSKHFSSYTFLAKKDFSKKEACLEAFRKKLISPLRISSHISYFRPEVFTENESTPSD